VSTSPAAKFFVNQGVVASPTDMLHLLKTVAEADDLLPLHAGPRRRRAWHGLGGTDRHRRARDVDLLHAAGDHADIDSFEHLEFETRPDQLLVYTLVQGDERVIVEFAPIGADAESTSPFAPRQLEFDTSEYVQMELLGLESSEDE
jgi:hypothetical protein